MWKTNPISGQSGSVERSIVQNEANFWLRRDGKASEPEALGQSCETKPSLGEPGYLGGGAW